MNYQFLSAAREDLKRTKSYYNARKPGLGGQFVEAFHAALERVVFDPVSYERIRESVHTISLKRFPYSIYYHVSEQKLMITIICVTHQHRRPGVWEDRLSEFEWAMEDSTADDSEE